MFRPIATVLLICAALLAASPSADARDRRQEREEVGDTVRRVERETGGEVLRAEPMQREGREVYRLKVLTPEGRVRVVQDDPNAPREQRQDDRRVREAYREPVEREPENQRDQRPPPASDEDPYRQ